MNMSREEFIEKNVDELYGWSMASVSLIEHDDSKETTLSFMKLGKWGRNQMKRVREILGRMCDADNALAPRIPVPPLQPAANGNGQHKTTAAVKP